MLLLSVQEFPMCGERALPSRRVLFELFLAFTQLDHSRRYDLT